MNTENKSREKDATIEETKSLTQSSRSMVDNELMIILGKDFVIYPKVFNPKIFFSSSWFADRVALLTKNCSTFCEVGCGSGIISITTAFQNPHLHIWSLDINDAAVLNTKDNIARFSFQDRISVVQSDVFSGINRAQIFEAIFWAMPFGYLDKDKKVDMVDLQTFDPAYQAIERYFATAKQHLTKNGKLYFGFSEEIGDKALLNMLAEKYAYKLNLIDELRGREISSVTMQIFEAQNQTA